MAAEPVVDSAAKPSDPEPPSDAAPTKADAPNGNAPAADSQPSDKMAVETPELDDFGLPIRKFTGPVAPARPRVRERRTGSLNNRARSISLASKASKKSSSSKEAAKAADSDSSDDDFKDAAESIPSRPVSFVADDVVADPDLSSDEPLTPLPPNIASVVLPGNDAPVYLTDKADEALDKAGVEKKNPVVDHSRDTSIASATNGLSEFSHYAITAKKEDKTDNDDGEWQEMPSYAPYDIYDDDNKLVAKEHNEDEEEKYGYAGLGGAGKGYTKVLVDDDAESATSMDDNTKYLFNNQVKGNTSVLEEDGAQRDAVSQMQATKDLLTEGQRIAYVGITRLELSTLVKEAEAVEKTKKIKKEVNMAAEATRMWAQKMMIRLYTHMEISSAEQIMIEQLDAHGVIPKDLVPVLMANARVKNPMAEPTSSPNSNGAKSPRPPPSPRPPEYEEVAEAPPAYDKHKGEELPEAQMPSQLPNTAKIDIDIRWTVLCDLFLVLIADSIYDARSRILLERVGNSLEIPWLDICRFEKRVTDALEMQQNAEKENWNEEEHMEHRRKMAQTRRYVMMGLCTVGGGLVIGLSAGLLAPVIGAGLAAGFTTLGVTGTGTFLAGAGGAAIITSGAAASGGIIGVRAANRRMGSVRTFEYRPLHNNKRVNLIVTVSGWMTSKVDDVRLPYSTVDPVMGDIYSVLWEPEMLTSMGDTINILATEALTQGLQQLLGSTILISLMAALQLPVVLTKLSYLIDNPWAVSLDRATSAGLILADSLIDRNLGTRPVTLVGYSLGSRVIHSCLQELARKGAYGLVQNVFIFGSPVVVRKEEYLRSRTVVMGKFVNGYNRNDWILGYLFRLTNGGIRRVAGLAAVEGIPWLENMDLTGMVTGHMEYRTAMPRLLRECGWLVESDEFREIEDPDPENHKERQRELINEIEEARKELEREARAKKGSAFRFFSRKKQAERAEWEVYEDAAKAGGAAAAVAAATAAGVVLAGPGQTEGGKEGGGTMGVLFDVDAIRAELAREKLEVAQESLQVRELPSTLPPMRLDYSPRSSLGPQDLEPPAPSSRRSSLRGGLPLSGAASPSRSSYEARPSPERTPTLPPASEGPPPTPPAKDAPAAATLGRNLTRHPSGAAPQIRVEVPWTDPDDEDFGKEAEEIQMTFA